MSLKRAGCGLTSRNLRRILCSQLSLMMRFSEHARQYKQKQRLEALVAYLPAGGNLNLGDTGFGARVIPGTGIACYPQRVVALRALAGQSDSPALSLSDTQYVMPEAAVSDVLGFFHSTKTTVLKSILRRGLLPQGRMGSMHSIYPPDDARARSMQRWRAGVEYNITLVLNTRRTWEYANKVSHGIYFNIL